MNVLQHTRNELNLCLKENRPDRSYRDTLLIHVLKWTFLKNVFKDTFATLIMRHQIDLHDFFRENLSLKPNCGLQKSTDTQ